MNLSLMPQKMDLPCISILSRRSQISILIKIGTLHYKIQKKSIYRQMQSHLPENKLNQMFGFYCPSTKEFFYFPTKELYQRYIKWAKEEKESFEMDEMQNNSQENQSGCSKTLADTQMSGQRSKENIQQYYSSLIDDDIRQIFNHPLFSANKKQVTLTEYQI